MKEQGSDRLRAGRGSHRDIRSASAASRASSRAGPARLPAQRARESAAPTTSPTSWASWVRTFAAIADDLQHHYLLAYTPKRPPDGTWREIEVKVKRSDAALRRAQGLFRGQAHARTEDRPRGRRRRQLESRLATGPPRRVEAAAGWPPLSRLPDRASPHRREGTTRAKVRQLPGAATGGQALRQVPPGRHLGDRGQGRLPGLWKPREQAARGRRRPGGARHADERATLFHCQRGTRHRALRATPRRRTAGGRWLWAINAGRLCNYLVPPRLPPRDVLRRAGRDGGRRRGEIPRGRAAPSSPSNAGGSSGSEPAACTAITCPRRRSSAVDACAGYFVSRLPVRPLRVEVFQ
jgi:hypothetical protein